MSVRYKGLIIAFSIPLVLSGCASFSTSPVGKWLTSGVKYDATVLRNAALSLEAAIANAAKNGGKAVASDVTAVAANPAPFCQIIIDMDQIAQAANSAGLFPSNNAALSVAVVVLHDLATNSAIVATANGVPPASPLAVASSVISTAMQIKQATAGTAKPVTPTAAAAAVAAK